MSMQALLTQMDLAFDKSSEAYQELIGIESIGEVVAQELLDFFEEDHNRGEVLRLMGSIKIRDFEQNVQKNLPLAGKTLVFTGTLPTLTRSEAKTKALAAGAKVAGSVSKKTDFVVLGEEAGSKAEKARELGVSILSEQDFIDLCNNRK